MNWYLQACPVCRGDLHDDAEARGWTKCMMCARSFPLRRQSLAAQHTILKGKPTVTEKEPLRPRRRFCAEEVRAA